MHETVWIPLKSWETNEAVTPHHTSHYHFLLLYSILAGSTMRSNAYVASSASVSLFPLSMTFGFSTKPSESCEID
jgi:hypothetical protein